MPPPAFLIPITCPPNSHSSSLAPCSSMQVKQHGHESLAGHGAGKALGKADLLRLARRLVVMNILQEETTRKGNSFNEFTTLSSHVVVRDWESFASASGELPCHTAGGLVATVRVIQLSLQCRWVCGAQSTLSRDSLCPDPLDV